MRVKPGGWLCWLWHGPDWFMAWDSDAPMPDGTYGGWREWCAKCKEWLSDEATA